MTANDTSSDLIIFKSLTTRSNHLSWVLPLFGPCDLMGFTIFSPFRISYISLSVWMRNSTSLTWNSQLILFMIFRSNILIYSRTNIPNDFSFIYKRQVIKMMPGMFENKLKRYKLFKALQMLFLTIRFKKW